MSPPPTQTQTHQNMDVPLSLRHQSSDVSDHVELHVMGTRPLLFTLPLLFSPRPTCIVNHCQVHKRLSNDTQPLISGGARLHATLQTCRKLPVLTAIVTFIFLLLHIFV